MNELAIAVLLCGMLDASVGEKREVFTNQGTERHVRVDCSTDSHVIEIGLDSVSSRDSVHQAVFAHVLSNKTPFIVVIDRDGEVGRYEQEIEKVADSVGVGYTRCSKDQILAWQATSPWRSIGNDKNLNDLPTFTRGPQCNLRPLIEGLDK